MKLDKATFEILLDEFEDFRDDIQKMVAEREHKRLENLQQQKLKKDMLEQFSELNKLAQKINFDKISQERATTIAIRKMQTLGGGGGSPGIKSMSTMSLQTANFGFMNNEANSPLFGQSTPARLGMNAFKKQATSAASSNAILSKDGAATPISK